MPVDPYEIFKEKSKPDPFAQFAEQRPDFAANPPGMPKPNVDMQYSTLGMLYNPQSVPREVRQGIIHAPLPGTTEGAGLTAGLAEYSKDVAGPIAGGAKDIYQGNVARGSHEIIGGVGTAMAPAIIPAATAAPIPTAAVLGASYLGGKLAKYGARGLGASPDQALLAEDIGNILTGYGVVKGAGGIKTLMEGPGTPAERLSAALSKTLPKAQWAKVNERIGAVSDKIPEVVGGAQNVGEVATRMKVRSLQLQDQFSDAIKPYTGQDVTPQVNRLKASLEQAATNADPYSAANYRSMAEKVGELKTLGQLDDFVRGFNKTRRFNAGPESMVRQSLTETVRGITGQDFSPLRLEQSHWMNLSQAAQKAAIPEQLAAVQSRVTSPTRKAVQAVTDLPMSKFSAILKGAKLLQPSQRSLIRGIEAPAQAPLATRPQATFPEESLNAIREGGAETRRSSAQFIQDVIQRRGLPTDPRIADIEAAVKGRAAEMAAKYPVPQYQPIRDPFAPPATPQDVYTPKVVEQHATALEQAKQQLPNGSLSEILQLAAKIQRGGP